LAVSSGAFSNSYGGLGITPDGWFWTLNNDGVQILQGMTASAPISPPTVTCGSNEDVERGAEPFIVGPDGTWLFSPNQSRNGGTSFPMLCAVVY
jgi:hypothetical protein